MPPGDGAASAVEDPDRRALERALAAIDVPFELFACDPALADTTAFCNAYGFSPEDAANTIVVMGKSNPPRYAACVVLATHRLDVNRTVRDRLGTRKASFASPDETRALTGMMIGGVTVLALPAGLPVYVDDTLMDLPWIILGGGSRSLKIKVSPEVLRTLPGATIVPGLSQPV